MFVLESFEIRRRGCWGNVDIGFGEVGPGCFRGDVRAVSVELESISIGPTSTGYSSTPSLSWALIAKGILWKKKSFMQSLVMTVSYL